MRRRATAFTAWELQCGRRMCGPHARLSTEQRVRAVRCAHHIDWSLPAVMQDAVVAHANRRYRIISLLQCAFRFLLQHLPLPDATTQRAKCNIKRYSIGHKLDEALCALLDCEDGAHPAIDA